MVYGISRCFKIDSRRFGPWRVRETVTHWDVPKINLAARSQPCLTIKILNSP